MNRMHIVLPVFVSVVATAQSHASTYYVNSACSTSGTGLTSGCVGTDRAKKTIAEGIALANDGDVVKVVPGTYTGSGNRGISFVDAMTLVCDGTPGTCVVDCDGATFGFEFDHAEQGADVESTIDGFTITDCSYASFGGAIYVSNTKPHILNCTITGNSANYGGGIGIIKEARPIIENCVIIDNTSVSAGGGIYVSHIGSDANVFATIRNSIIGTIEEPNVASHSSNGRGGGLYLEGPGQVVVSNTRIEGNVSKKQGAGICVVGADAVVQLANCTIARNSVDSNGDDGGGIAVLGGGAESEFEDRARVHLMNGVISANSARYGGGVFVDDLSNSNRYSQLELVNSVLYGNTAATANGGHEIYFSPHADSPDSTVANSVIWKLAETYKSVERISGTLSIEESNVSDLSSLSGISLSDNISSTPLFIDPDGADDELGTVDDDFRVQNTSPHIDRADESLRLPDYGDLDEDDNLGEATPLDLGLDARVIGCDVDMGAFEFRRPCPEASIVSASPVSGTIDARHPHPQTDNSFSARRGIGSPNSYTGGPEPIVITLDPEVAGGGGVDCWSLCETGIEDVDEGTEELDPNIIISACERENDPGVYEILLERPISAGHWTTITYEGSGDYVAYASLPADANGDETAAPADLLDLIDYINNTQSEPFGNYSCDIDHSGTCNSSDVYELNDLRNGEDDFIEWYYVSLPENDCPGESFMMGGGSSPDEESANAAFAERFVTFLSTSDPQDEQSVNDFESYVGMLTDLCVNRLTEKQRADLVEALTDPGLTVASKVAEEMIPGIVGLLE